MSCPRLSIPRGCGALGWTVLCAAALVPACRTLEKGVTTGHESVEEFAMECVWELHRLPVDDPPTIAIPMQNNRNLLVGFANPDRIGLYNADTHAFELVADLGGISTLVVNRDENAVDFIKCSERDIFTPELWTCTFRDKQPKLVRQLPRFGIPQFLCAPDRTVGLLLGEGVDPRPGHPARALTIHHYPYAGGDESRPLVTLDDATMFGSIAATPDLRCAIFGTYSERWLYVNAGHGLVQVRDLASCLDRFITLDPTGTFLAGGYLDGVFLYAIRTETRHALDSGIDPMRSVAFSADGRLLAIGDEHGRLEVWDTTFRRRIYATAFDDMPVKQLTFDDAHRRIVFVNDSAVMIGTYRITE